MGNGVKPGLRFRSRLMLRNALVYGSWGMVSGASLCAIVLFIGKNGKEEPGKNDLVEEKPLTVCIGESVQLQPSIQGDVYRWTPAEGLDNTRIANPFAAPLRTTEYKATVYRKTKTIVSSGERFRIMATALNGSNTEKTLWRYAVEAPEGPCLITLQSRTTEFLDKAVLQLRVNNKPIATYNAKSEAGDVLETVWNNKSTDPFTVSVHLLSYDGTADVLECSRLEICALAATDVVTEVRVEKNCKGCETPQPPSVVNLSPKEVRFEWNENANGFKLVRYKTTKEKDWNYATTKGKVAQLHDLKHDADYVMQAATICKNDTSDWCPRVFSRATDRQLSSTWVEAQR